MAQLKVEDYVPVRTAANIKDDDLFDITATDDAGVSYDSAKMTWAEMKVAVQAAVSAVNLYNANGALTGNRAVDLATNTLAFTGGNTGFGVAPTLGRVHVKSASGVNGLYVEDNLAALRLALSDEGLLDLRSVSAHSTVVGQLAGNATFSGDNNTLFGYQVGHALTTGYYNSFFGSGAGSNNTEGYRNSFFGFGAGFTNIDGDENTMLGYKAGYGCTGSENTLIGYQAGHGNIGNKNAFLGYNAGYTGAGSENVSLGYEAGYNSTGDNNVFIGYQAGYNETGSDLLYIANSNTATPLIWGDFANTLLDINGYLSLNSIKSGATQVASGAAANEIWKTVSHATLPDNVLLIGV